MKAPRCEALNDTGLQCRRGARWLTNGRHICLRHANLLYAGKSIQLIAKKVAA